MANSRSSNGKKKNNGIINLKTVVEKLQKSLLLVKNKKSAYNTDDEFDEVVESKCIPRDVKEGHFAVIAVDEEGFKRFIVPLSYLTNPLFLRLLERAAEEYGFNNDGALMVPCRPSEMEKMLGEERNGGGGECKWSSSHERSIFSC